MYNEFYHIYPKLYNIYTYTPCIKLTLFTHETICAKYITSDKRVFKSQTIIMKFEHVFDF